MKTKIKRKTASVVFFISDLALGNSLHIDKLGIEAYNVF